MGMNKRIHLRKNAWVQKCIPWVLWAVAVLAFSMYLAYERVVVCDYSSVNGDFQSYNVFRRMMDGQIPFVDFANYIGMAPVYLNYPLVAALGGSFRDSLFVTNFTSHILFCICSFLILWFCSGSKYLSLIISCVLAKVVSTQIHYFVLGPTYGWIFNERFTGMYTPSNSMRIARCFLPFLLVLIAVLWLRGKKQTEANRPLLNCARSFQGCAVLGAVLGLTITWGGEYGLACIITATVILVFLHIAEYRLPIGQTLLHFCVYFAAMAAGAFLSMAVVTAGHPFAWLKSFLATGEYQSFYFCGIVRQTAVEDLLLNKDFWISAVPFVVCLIWLTIRLFCRKMTDRQLLQYFLLAVILAGTVAYILTGSGFNCREPLQVFTLIALVGWMIGALRRMRFWRRCCRLIRACQLVVLCAAALYLGSQGVLAATGVTDRVVSGQYVDAFEGYTNVYDALVTADEITGDDQVFSVYATGLELVKGQYQPTGYDYIIHALGKDAQAHYVDTFLTGGYRWAQTPKMQIEGWLAMENWYFYRELYANYSRSFETEYSWMWEYSGDRVLDADVSIEVRKEDDGSVVLELTSDKKETFIADIYLKYQTEFTGVGAALLGLGRENITVTSLGIYPEVENIHFRQILGGDSETYFPVVMKDGHGTVILQGFDRDGVRVTEVEAEFCRALPRYTLFSESLS